MTQKEYKDALSRLTQLSAFIDAEKAALTEAKKKIKHHCESYANNVVYRSQFSPEAFVSEFKGIISKLREIKKELHSSRLEHNKLYFELGGERGADKLKLNGSTENAEDCKSANSTKQSSENPNDVRSLDLDGFLTMSEAKTLFEALYQYITNAEPDEMFEVNVKVDGDEFFLSPVSKEQ